MRLVQGVAGLLLATGGLALLGHAFPSMGLTDANVITIAGGVLMYTGGLIVGAAFHDL